MLEITGIVALGILVGALSGFLGIGGGTIVIPALLLLGFDIKSAIGISVIQMLCSSLFGSYLNFKKGTLEVQVVLILGIGGFTGALTSSTISAHLSEKTLEILFLFFVILGLLRMFFPVSKKPQRENPHPVLLFFLGVVVGAFALSIGVGGSLLLIPILVGFFHIPLTKAVSAGLFFVIFSSFSGVLTRSIQGSLNYYWGFMLGIPSLLGVYYGIHLKHLVSEKVQRSVIFTYYTLIAEYFFYRLL